MSIKSVMPSNHLILCHPLLLLPSIPPRIRVFSNESALCIRWPKYWSFSFNISPSNEHPGLISFRVDWLDLLAVQGTLKNLLQHHSSKASILQCSAFFIVQLSHPHMTTRKTIALTRWAFVDKVMSLLFNMMSRLVITFLPRSKRLLISWLQSPSAGILEPRKIKATVSIISPFICHKVMGLDAMILVFWTLSFKPSFSLFSFTFIKRLFSSSLSAIRVVSSAYLRLLIFLPAILTPACASSSPAFLVMCSAQKLNKQGDNIQPWRTAFPTWNQSVVPCPVLTVTDQFQHFNHMSLLILLPRLKIQLLFGICYATGIRKKVKEKAEPQLYLKLLFQEGKFYIFWSHWSKLVKCWSRPSVYKQVKSTHRRNCKSHGNRW